MDMIIESMKRVEINTSTATDSWIHSFKDDLIEWNCLCCNINYWQKFDEKLKQRISNT